MQQYDWQEIKRKIITRSKGLAIDKIGFTTAEPFSNIEEILINHQKRGFGSGFEETDIQKRIDPKRSLKEAQSIVSIGVAYSPIEPLRYEESHRIRGKFCRASWGQDYHHILTDKLSALSLYIKELIPTTETLIMVDKGPLVDRAVAARAGIGWIGKSGNLITPEYGSFVFLGEVLTNLPLPPDEPLTIECGHCEKCLKACPMDAILIGEHTINCNKCLAYQTINRNILEDEVKEEIAIRGYIYGCDLCQLSCPYNNGIKNDWHEAFSTLYETVNPCLHSLIKISNKEFKENFNHLAGSWRGKKVLQRNAILILGKHKDNNSIPILKEVLFSDPRPEIQEAAVWSLGKFNLDETKGILKEALNIIENQEVRQAIIKKLDTNTC